MNCIFYLLFFDSSWSICFKIKRKNLKKSDYPWNVAVNLAAMDPEIWAKNVEGYSKDKFKKIFEIKTHDMRCPRNSPLNVNLTMGRLCLKHGTNHVKKYFR